MKKILLALVWLCAIHLTNAQTHIEISFIKGNHQEVLAATAGLSSTDDFYWHAQALAKLGSLAQATKVLEKGLQDSIHAAQLEPLLAQFYYQSGMYHKALPLLYKHSKRTELFPMLLSVLEFSDRYAEAIALNKTKLMTDSLNADTWKKLGNQYYAVQLFDSAQLAYKHALQLNPQDLATAYLQANLLIKTKQYAEAIEICDQMLTIDSVNIKFTNAKALALFKNKSYARAGKYFDKSLQLGDSSRFVLRHLGISKVISGLYYEGIDHLSIALKGDSTDVEANFFMGKAYSFTDTCEKGLYYLNIADSLMKPNASVLANIWIEKHHIYSSLGQHQNSVRCIEEAYKLSPAPEYLYHMANYYQYEMGNSEKALLNYERFIKSLDAITPPNTVHSDTAMAITPQGGTINMRQTAEKNIRALREELFFQNNLK